jgi:hypothetical protein
MIADERCGVQMQNAECSVPFGAKIPDVTVLKNSVNFMKPF